MLRRAWHQIDHEALNSYHPECGQRCIPNGLVAWSDRTEKLWSIVMSILAWIALGLVAVFIASKIVNKTGEGMLIDIVLGMVGAVVGGFLFDQSGAAGVTGFNIYSLFVAAICAVVACQIYHMVVGRSATIS
jgi:uncharacterized membrane protein YeaQ/YmgE (transglycosylase-associated protein family)